ncbi:MAG: site-2 protease family protein [Planctomycetota bacterium]
MDWGHVATLFVLLLFSLTAHEAAHAWAAKLGGDLTAYRQGLVTLNPLPHARREPIGMLLVPLVVLYLSGGRYCFGGASAPIDALWAARHPRRAALTSLAGPMANFALAGLGLVAMAWIARPDPSQSWQGTTFDVAHLAFQLNLVLALFNLLPLPPFDGAGVVGGLSRPMQRLYDTYARLPLASVVSMVVAWNLLPYVFLPAYDVLTDLLPYSPRFRG